MAHEKLSLQVHNLNEVDMDEALDLAIANASARRSAAEIEISLEEAEQVNGGIGVSTTTISKVPCPIITVGLIYEPDASLM
ncbi:hypothetical protein [Altericista sp. CCNU0014]|uniref:hypothetical protein n=1 Tax=Altericista sp. CCNU0014 TaxID=3082949 RepID=UPI00384CC732